MTRLERRLRRLARRTVRTIRAVEAVVEAKRRGAEILAQRREAELLDGAVSLAEALAVLLELGLSRGKYPDSGTAAYIPGQATG
jgi:hypothetical protein